MEFPAAEESFAGLRKAGWLVSDKWFDTGEGIPCLAAALTF
jgi:hypothetical protein